MKQITYIKQKSFIFVIVFVNFISYWSFPAIATTVSTDVAIAGDLIINEINWKGSSASASDQWVEILNTTENKVIDMTKISIHGAATTSGTPKILTLKGSLAPGAFYILSNFATTSASTLLTFTHHSDASVDLKETFHLILKTVDDTVIEEVNNGTKQLTISSSNPTNASLGRREFSKSPTQSKDWKYSYRKTNFQQKQMCDKDFGTPGAHNFESEWNVNEYNFKDLCIPGTSAIRHQEGIQILYPQSLQTIFSLDHSFPTISGNYAIKLNGTTNYATTKPWDVAEIVLNTTSKEISLGVITHNQLTEQSFPLSFVIPANMQNAKVGVKISASSQQFELILSSISIKEMSGSEVPAIPSTYIQVAGQATGTAGISKETKNLRLRSVLKFSQLPNTLSPFETIASIKTTNPFTNFSVEKNIRAKDAAIETTQTFNQYFVNHDHGYYKHEVLFKDGILADIISLTLEEGVGFSEKTTFEISETLLEKVTYRYELPEIVKVNKSENSAGKILAKKNLTHCQTTNKCTLEMSLSLSNISSENTRLIDILFYGHTNDGKVIHSKKSVSQSDVTQNKMVIKLEIDEKTKETGFSVFTYDKSDLALFSLDIKGESSQSIKPLLAQTKNKTWEKGLTIHPSQELVDIFKTDKIVMPGKYRFTTEFTPKTITTNSKSKIILVGYNSRGIRILNKSIAAKDILQGNVKNLIVDLEIDRSEDLRFFLYFTGQDPKDSVEISKPTLAGITA